MGQLDIATKAAAFFQAFGPYSAIVGLLIVVVVLFRWARQEQREKFQLAYQLHPLTEELKQILSTSARRAKSKAPATAPRHEAAEHSVAESSDEPLRLEARADADRAPQRARSGPARPQPLAPILREEDTDEFHIVSLAAAKALASKTLRAPPPPAIPPLPPHRWRNDASKPEHNEHNDPGSAASRPTNTPDRSLNTPGRPLNTAIAVGAASRLQKKG